MFGLFDGKEKKLKKQAMKKVILAVLWFIYFDSIAGPDKLTKYLINEPVTLMDLGLLRTKMAVIKKLKTIHSTGWFKDFKDLGVGIHEVTVETKYVLSTNRIIVSADVHITHPINEKKVKSLCSSVIQSTKISLGIFNAFIPGDKNLIAKPESYFLHAGWTTAAHKLSFYKNIRKIIYIKVDIRDGFLIPLLRKHSDKKREDILLLYKKLRGNWTGVSCEANFLDEKNILYSK